MASFVPTGPGPWAGSSAPMIYRFDAFALDDDAFELRRDGERVALEPRVLDLLAYLVAHPDRLVTKEELLARLWDGLSVSESSLTRCVSMLRAALGDSRGHARIVETVHGRGYRFRPEVHRSAPGDLAPGLPRKNAGAFVGRQGVLGQIDAALDEAIAGRGRLILLSGEAGIGKTRTAEQAARLATQRGAAVRIGRCREDLGAPPLWPWGQVLRQEIEACGVAEVQGRLGADARFVAQLVPEVLAGERPGASRVAAAEAVTDRFQLFDCVWRYWRAACSERPRLIVLDDLHRADQTSLALLRFVASEVGDARLLVIGTYRQAELDADREKAAHTTGLLREPTTQSIAMTGLAVADVIELASAIGDTRPSDDDAERLRAYTGGNPFFLHHVLPELDLAGPEPLAGRLPPLPHGIRSALAGDFDRLGDRARTLLQAAAVLGREFHVGVAAQVCEVGVAMALRDLQPAIASRLVDERPGRPGHFRFVHELVREALYEGLGSLARSQLHLRSGEVLQKGYPTEPGPHLAELTHHFLKAVPLVDGARVFRCARAAGDWAQGQMAYDEAVESYTRALRMLDGLGEDAASRCDLLIALTEAEARSGRRAAAAAHGLLAAELAGTLDSPERLARAALAVSPGFFALEIGVFDVQLAALLERALDALRPASPDDFALRARLLGRLALCLYWSGRTDQLRRVSAAADEAAARAGNEEALGHALVARHAACGGPEGSVQRLALAGDLVRHARRVGDPEQTLMGQVFGLTALLEQGRIAELDRELGQLEKAVEQLRQPQSFWYGRMYRAARALMHGDWAAARTRARSYLAIGTRFDDNNVLHCFATHTLLSTLECDLGDGVLAGAEQHMNAHPEYPTWRAGLAWGAAEVGRADVAEPLLDEAVDHLLAGLPRDINWLCTVSLFAYTAWHLDAARHAEVLYHLLAPFEDRVVTAGFGMVCFGSVDAYLGRMAALRGQPDVALGHFDRAEARDRQMGAQPWVVRGLEGRAEALQRSGRRNEALSVAGQACGAAQRLQMVRVAERLGRRFGLEGPARDGADLGKILRNP